MYDIPIIMLHCVNETPGDHPMGALAIYPAEFEAYLKILKSQKYQMISMNQLLNKNYDSSKPFAVLTFDDGFKDTLTVAQPIMKKYGAHGTVFVNPIYQSVASDPNSNWGFMTRDELLQANADGILDIQAHTMTHEFIFTSDQIIDFYSPEKFNKYYWLAWMLFPDAPMKWDSTAIQYKSRIPTGYPIFEYGRRLASKKFSPATSYVEKCISEYNKSGEFAKEKLNKCNDEKGVLESTEDFSRVVQWQVAGCKEELEHLLNKDIHTLCFPGGGYTDEVLRITEDAGYRCYMNASRLRNGNNNDNFRIIESGRFCGLNRMSFSIRRFKMIPKSVSASVVSGIKMRSYQNNPIARTTMSILRHI